MSNALAVIETLVPSEIFKPGGIDITLDRIKVEVRAMKFDISNKSGREDCASLAFKIAKSKTFLDSVRKELVADEKKRLKAIDTEGARIWDELEDLQKEVRKPLTDWENAEKDRVAAHEAALAAIPESSMYGALESSEDVRKRLEYLGTALDSRDWQEFSARAKFSIDAEIVRMKGILAIVERREQEAAELGRLRAEQAERDAKERDERIARESAERERAIALAREAAAALAAQAERNRIEDEKFQAEKRAKEAEIRAESERLAAIERERIAAEKAKADMLAAVEGEQKRLEAIATKAAAEATERERNKAHAGKVNREVRDALVREGLTVAEATNIVKALACGLIPHTKISY